MAFTYRVVEKPDPKQELVARCATLRATDRLELTASPKELRSLQIYLLVTRGLKGKITTRLNGDGLLYVEKK